MYLKTQKNRTMRSLTIIGLVLFGIAALLFYATTNFSIGEMKLSHFMGIMAGVGLGLIIGGIVGYVSKGSAIKEDERRKAYKQLEKDKLELEKQQQTLAKELEEAAKQQNKEQNYL